MKKKVVSIMMTAALAVGMLAGCGNSDSGSSNAASGNDSKSTSEAGSTSASASNAAEEEEITTTLTVWSPSEDQASDSGEWLQTMCNQFAEEHPSWHITFDYGVCAESDAKDTVTQDVEGAADVYMFANDNLTSLIAALHIYILLLEMFWWDKPKGLRAFGMTAEFAAATKTLAANQGLYNGFLAAGLLWGLWLGQEGVPVQVFFLVTLPNILPSLIAAWMLTFTLSFDDVVISEFLSGPGVTTLPQVIFGYARRGVNPSIYAAATILILTVSVGIIAYSLQLYFDFSGYSMMGIGMGKMLGFDFPANFNYPYISASITEFWRRWHMTLSGWFREYVYIPLGGNRKGLKRQILNLFVVELLTGIWHGANWNFICWGLYYFVLLAAEKLFLLPHLQKGRVWPHIYTLFLVVVGWAMFVGNDTGVSFGLLFHKLFVPSGGVSPLYFLRNYGVLLAVSILCCTPLIEKLWNALRKHTVTRVAAVLVLLVLSTAYVVGSTNSPFLYFNF